MTAADTPPQTPTASRLHIALHLAHRWFAFFEARGGHLDTHLEIFHPRIQLSGHRMKHMFAQDHASLRAWFAAVPDEVSSHHIVHSNYATADNGDGLLSMVVAYQAPGELAMQGSIISYETRIEFAVQGPRFVAIDKTPILPNRRPDYETSWATNRVLARVHAELGGLSPSDGDLRKLLGSHVRQVCAHVAAPEGSGDYEALVTGIDSATGKVAVVRLKLSDDVRSSMPTIERVHAVTP